MNLREWALPVYTILVQLAFGALLTLWLVRAFTAARYGKDRANHVIDMALIIIFMTIAAGMIGAHFHLSRAYLSFLALLNLHRSWLSREILFNLLFFFSTGGLIYLQFWGKNAWRLKTVLGWLAILFGAANIYCMAHIYLLQTQLVWDTPMTILSFFTTTLLLGMMALASILLMDLKYSELRNLPKAGVQAQVIQKTLGRLAAASVIMASLVIAENAYQLLLLSQSSLETAQASLRLLLQLYPALLGMRMVAMILGVAGMAGAVYWYFRHGKPASDLLVPAYLTLLFVMVGEILGRFLFYATHVRLGV
jgi:anaerobic dimethyl sulfoxide reductase subunit C (anchor subunit)